jgi:hypothetical protein
MIVGRTGTGKSFLARKIYSLWPRRIIFDPHREHESESGGAHAWNPFHVVTPDAKYAAELALAAGDCILVYDDAMTYLTHPLPSPFSDIVAAGRHRQISILAITQRLPDVAPAFRAQVDVMIAFKQTMRYDARTLERDWGISENKVRRLEGHEYLFEVYSDNKLTMIRSLSSSSLSI